MLGCEKVTVEMPSKTVLDGISVGVDSGERIGIVGRNGDGKSTLLNVLSSALEPDSGRVIRTGGVTVGVLAQSDDLDDDATVQQSVVGDVPEYVWASDAKIRAIFQNLLEDIEWDRRVGELSGGQRRRVDLARVLAGDWDVLMLDEPTNHLDIRAITWLASHLKTRWRQGAGALLVVTHDRWFLDEVCNSMWEVHAGRVIPFEGGFSAYIMQRVERDRLEALAEQKRQNALRRELAWLSRGARARATKPKFHVAAARELIADVPELRDELQLKRMAMARIGKQVVDIHQATVSFGNRTVLDQVEWMIGPGDRIGIVGGNGAGKTTLLKLIEGKLTPNAGRVKIGQTVQFAVLSQHLDNLAEFEDDVVRVAISRFPHRIMLDGKDTSATDLLEKLGFGRADLNERVGDLSGGQKRRLALMMILLEQPNVLILDEPGNDLDIDMLAAVEDMLDGWPGTLILVTHDRYLMERVTDDQYALLGGKLKHLPRGVDEYLELEAEAREGRSSTPSAKAAEAAGAPAEDAPEQPLLSNAERHRLTKLVASLERRMDTASTKIEAAKEALQGTDPTDFQALTAAQAEVTEAEAALAALEEEWLEASEQLAV
ncbi:MAG: ABC-F family ATP-binding cassette domain-containing protein [Eggerthellaceae bacterium]|nr:ABC-F family ATP-binding cassette domain-containing protein [Eggerthellaceae bacterium]